MTKWQLLVAVVCLVLLIGTAAAMADEPASCSFWGTARVDGGDANGGILVTAIINGDEYHTYTATEHEYSTYSIIIRPPATKSYPDGTKVSFKVNGHVAEQTSTFISGGNQRLDLVGSLPLVQPPASSSLTPLTLLLVASIVLAILTAGAIVYYFVLRTKTKVVFVDLVSRLRNQLSKSSPKQVAAVERASVLLPRYVWDGNKLAWVPSVQPTRRPSQVATSSVTSPRMQQPVSQAPVIRNPTARSNTVAALPRSDTSTIVKPLPVAQKEIAPVKDKGSDDKQESLALYKGTVELVLSPPLTLTAVRRFNEHLTYLRHNHQVEILNLEQSRSKGIQIQLFIPTPIKLVKILQSLQEVDTVSDGHNKFNGINPERYSRVKPGLRRITVRFKK